MARPEKAQRIQLPVRARERRTHAERTAETRARVIQAVFDSVSELGFQRTTAVEITRRAGVTWGAVQHHFGDKDGILVAVLEDSFNRFAARLEDIPVESSTLQERAALFVDGAWQHFASAEYRSTFEILLHYSRGDASGPAPNWQREMFLAWDRIWMRLFHDARISRRRHVVLEHYTVSTLQGLASTLMLEGEQAQIQPEEIQLLRDVLARELAGGKT